MSENGKPIILSAGGTGGHMYPAMALAQDLKSRGYKVVLFTDGRGRKYAEKFEGIRTHTINAGTLGSGVIGKIKGAFSLAIGYFQARHKIEQMEPCVVVGFGGYPSVPGVLAAQHKRIPTVIHEQNAILGRANAFLAPRADRIALSLSRVQGFEEADAVRAVVTGNPVREDIAELYTKPYPSLQQDGPLNILVLGGSQGAHVFADVLPRALSKLPDDYKARLHVTQQCRDEDIDPVRAAYDNAKIEARLSPFFDDVAAIMAQAHLVIARSGASTVAEN